MRQRGSLAGEPSARDSRVAAWFDCESRQLQGRHCERPRAMAMRQCCWAEPPVPPVWGTRWEWTQEQHWQATRKQQATVRRREKRRSGRASEVRQRRACRDRRLLRFREGSLTISANTNVPDETRTPEGVCKLCYVSDWQSKTA